MSDDNNKQIKTIIQQIILILKINNQNASNWMVRDFISSNYCNISFRSKRFSNSTKKIGSYVGKLKNTLSKFQKKFLTKEY